MNPHAVVSCNLAPSLSQAPPGLAPDVWSQLQEALSRVAQPLPAKRRVLW